MGFMFFVNPRVFQEKKRESTIEKAQKAGFGMHWQRSTTCPTTASCSKNSSPTFPSTTTGTKRPRLTNVQTDWIHDCVCAST